MRVAVVGVAMVALSLAFAGLPSSARVADDVLLDTITINATTNSAATGKVSLRKGTRYRLDVSGTMTASGPLRLDALYCYGDRTGGVECDPPTHQPTGPAGRGLFAGTRTTTLATRIDSFLDPNACCIGTVPYSPTHVYSVTYYPDIDGRLRLLTRDGTANCTSACPETTTGSFEVKIYGPASAQPTPTPTPTATPSPGPNTTDGIVRVSGITRKVEVQINEGSWQPMSADVQLRTGDRVHTGFKAGVVLTYPDGSRVAVGPMTMLEITDVGRGPEGGIKARIWLRLGDVSAQVNRSSGAASDFHVVTPTATASIRGTKFTVSYDGNTTAVKVTESSVEVTANNGKSVIVNAGMETRATAKSVSKPVKIGKGFKRGGLTSEQALTRLSTRLTKGLTRCRLGVVSQTAAPTSGGWAAKLVIVKAAEGIAAKPRGTARFTIKGKRIAAKNALGKRILAGCR